MGGRELVYKNRCFKCPHLYYDRSLQYMPEYQCSKYNFHHIYIGIPEAKGRPTWCPVYGAEDPENEEKEWYVWGKQDSDSI